MTALTPYIVKLTNARIALAHGSPIVRVAASNDNFAGDAA